jgi:hypothetical protein
MRLSILRGLMCCGFVFFLSSCGGGNSPAPNQPQEPSTTKFAGYFRRTKATSAAPASVGMRSFSAAESINPTVNMSYPREAHTATALPDGRILIAGGNTTRVNNPEFKLHDTAEIFDPETESFSLLTSSMSIPRTDHCATLLPNGLVLLLGGTDNQFPSSYVDIFDPSNGQFTATTVQDGNELPLSWGVCFTLPNNRVFVFGGATVSNGQTDGALPHVVDIQGWKARPVTLIGDSALFKRLDFGSVQLPDGRVVITGGMVDPYHQTTRVTSDIMLFDPADETMRVIGEMKEARAFHGSLVTASGDIEVYGGAHFDTSSTPQPIRLTSVERITPTGISSKIGDLPDTRVVFTSAMLQDGRSLHVGGAGRDGLSTRTQIIFDETSRASGYTGDMVEDRLRYSITPLKTGRILITGGSTSNLGVVSNTGEIFEPEANVYVFLPKTALAPGESVQLTAEYNGAVTWTAKFGTVDQSGLYTAPLSPTENFDEVTATAPTGARATARVTILIP